MVLETYIQCVEKTTTEKQVVLRFYHIAIPAGETETAQQRP